MIPVDRVVVAERAYPESGPWRVFGYPPLPTVYRLLETRDGVPYFTDEFASDFHGYTGPDYTPLDSVPEESVGSSPAGVEEYVPL